MQVSRIDSSLESTMPIQKKERHNNLFDIGKEKLSGELFNQKFKCKIKMIKSPMVKHIREHYKF